VGGTFRHFVDEGVDPFEVRRHVGRVAVALQVLDLNRREDSIPSGCGRNRSAFSHLGGGSSRRLRRLAGQPSAGMHRLADPARPNGERRKPSMPTPKITRFPLKR
jgi:hypothetical protein